jgi:hypothetical protein
MFLSKLFPPIPKLAAKGTPFNTKTRYPVRDVVIVDIWICVGMGIGQELEREWYFPDLIEYGNG